MTDEAVDGELSDLREGQEQVLERLDQIERRIKGGFLVIGVLFAIVLIL